MFKLIALNGIASENNVNAFIFFPLKFQKIHSDQKYLVLENVIFDIKNSLITYYRKIKIKRKTFNCEQTYRQIYGD